MFQFNYKTQDRRAGEDEVRTASTLQPGAKRTRRNQGWMLHLLLSLSLTCIWRDYRWTPLTGSF
jgi:hypothetical protein